MERFPLISVIVPVYNSESTILNTALSVLKQPNAKHIELILVDDGSTDGSSHIVDDLSISHNNVKVIHKENGGVSSARNIGIDHAKGRYLAFLDSDDWWEQGFLSDDLITALLDPQSSDLYAFSFQKVSPNKKWKKPIRIKNGAHNYDAPALSHIVGQPHCAFLYRRDFLRENNFRYLPTKVGEDIPFVQMSCTFARSITCIDKIMLSYYMNYDSCMHTKTSVSKFMEWYKAQYLARTIYESHNVAYDIDRIIVSLIGESLSGISLENPFGFVKKLISGKEFDLLNHSDIQPWSYLRKDVQLWRINPLLAYVKCKIKGAPVLIKRALTSWRLTRPLAEFIQYHLIEKWISI